MKKLTQEFSVVIIVLLPFLLSWFLSFGMNIFFNDKNLMSQPAAIPSMQPIGFDLKMTVDGSRALWEGKNPYEINSLSYTPFAFLFFSLLIPWSQTSIYFFISLLTISSVIVAIFLIDRVILRKIFIPFLLTFFIITSFFSYGLPIQT